MVLQIPVLKCEVDNKEALLEEVKTCTGKKLNQLLLKDFILQEPEGFDLSHGVYIFKKANEIIYVGKASSRPFIERVPAHLDIRGNGWMNNMLRYLAVYKNPGTFLKESLYAIEHFELIFVVFKNDECTSKNISAIERFLIYNTSCLNKKKRKK